MQQRLPRRFHIMTRRTVSRASGFELTNRAALFRKPDTMMMPPPGLRGFRDYPELPMFVADKKKGRLHWDLDTAVPYYWLVTEKMKALMEALDREAFEFLQCRVQFPDGSDAPPHWLCDVVRVLDAVDEEKSKVTIRTGQSGNKFYGGGGDMNLHFKPDVVGTSKFFRLYYNDDIVICDDEVKAACKAADLKGLRFVAQGLPPERPMASSFWVNGNSLRERGDIAAAIAAYGEAIRLGRDDTFYPRYLCHRAEAYLALKDIDGAIADYDEAIKSGPQNLNDLEQAVQLSWLAEAYWGRGKALLQKGDSTRAEQDFENARKLGYDGDFWQKIPRTGRV
jgi:tetratricopeptide (TPR) repeat protein